MLNGTRTRSGERSTERSQTDAFKDSLHQPEIDFDVVDRAAEVASQRGVPIAPVALAGSCIRRSDRSDRRPSIAA